MGAVAPLLGKLVGVDTSLFIYFIEKHPRYHPLVRPLFVAADRGDVRIVTSALTLAEVLVLPIRLNDLRLIERYTRILLRAENILSVEVSHSIAVRAANLRSAHRLRTPDAIQLATAVDQGADAFLTNDLALSKASGVEILLVEQLAGLVLRRSHFRAS